jgi:hypothetical protein
LHNSLILRGRRRPKLDDGRVGRGRRGAILDDFCILLLCMLGTQKLLAHGNCPIPKRAACAIWLTANS